MGSRISDTQVNRRARAIDGVLAGLLLIALWQLQPVMPDGDGLAHALRAIYSTYLDGIDVKHPLYAAFLRVISQISVLVGLRPHTIELLSFSSHLAAVGIFLLLARHLYPMFMTKTIATLSAAGVVVSYGLLSRGSTIEVYAPALCADVGLLAFILKSTARPAAFGMIAGVLFLVALGFHVTNILIAPLVVALLIYRVGRNRAVFTVMIFGATVSVGLLFFVMSLLAARGLSLWPPDILALAPKGDPQPPMSLLVRLGRAVYGMARTIGYLPPVRELTPAFGGAYIAASVTVGVALFYLAWRGQFLRRRDYIPLFGVLAIGSFPFILMGIYYFPSDPERWLFLLPIGWLVIGLIIANGSEGRQARVPSPVIGLTVLVVCITAYNAYELFPQTRVNRDLLGLQELTSRVSTDDLVISPGGINSRIYEFFLAPHPPFRNLTIVELVARYGSDRQNLEGELQRQIHETFAQGHRVYVHRLINEGHRKGENYPWAHFVQFDYEPDTFIAMLRRFNLNPAIPPNVNRAGTFQIEE